MLQFSGTGLQGKSGSSIVSSNSKKQRGLRFTGWERFKSYNVKELQGMQNMGERHKFQFRD